MCPKGMCAKGMCTTDGATRSAILARELQELMLRVSELQEKRFGRRDRARPASESRV